MRREVTPERETKEDNCKNGSAQHEPSLMEGLSRLAFLPRVLDGAHRRKCLVHDTADVAIPVSCLFGCFAVGGDDLRHFLSCPRLAMCGRFLPLGLAQETCASPHLHSR